MCERDDKGLTEYSALSRRRFAALSVAALAAAGPAVAESGKTQERDVRVTTPDGEADALLVRPAGRGRWPGVLVWPDAGGLRDAQKDIGRRLAAQGYVVLVVNPYYRSGGAAALAEAGAIRERRAELRALLTADAAFRDGAAFVAFLDGLRETSKAKVGVQGYCMGGPLSFRTAAAAPDRVGAVASFHGGGLVTANADSPHLLIEKTRARYLVAVAKNDDARDPAAKSVLQETFGRLQRPAVVEVYQGDHGWCVPDNGAYAPAEAERAWAALTTLYKAALV